MPIKVIRVNTQNQGTPFAQLEIGDFFRYCAPSNGNNLYVKTNYDGRGDLNTLHVNKGNSYHTRCGARVIKQDVLITVSDVCE